MRLRTPITEFAVIPAKVGMYLYQWVMGSGSSFPHCRNDGFKGNRVFFSILLGPASLAARRFGSKAWLNSSSGSIRSRNRQHLIGRNVSTKIDQREQS